VDLKASAVCTIAVPWNTTLPLVLNTVVLFRKVFSTYIIIISYYNDPPALGLGEGLTTSRHKKSNLLRNVNGSPWNWRVVVNTVLNLRVPRDFLTN
jgi:hypothetical protein